MHSNDQEICELLKIISETQARVDRLCGTNPATFPSLDTPSPARDDQYRRAFEIQTAILNALPAHVALVDGGGNIVAVNDAWKRFAEANGWNNPSYGVGLSYLGLCESVHGQEATDARMARAGLNAVLQQRVPEFAMEYPCASATEERWFRMVATPLKAEIAQGAVVMHINITERKLAEREMALSRERLGFLHDLGEATRTLTEPLQILETVASALGKQLKVSRCAYADVEGDGQRFRIQYDYRDGCASTVGEYELQLFGQAASRSMHEGKTLVVRNVSQESGDGMAMFHAIGIEAIICCPLLKEGRLRAMMAVHQTTPRDWSAWEIALVEEVVERCWAIIERARVERAHRTTLERYRLIVESSHEVIWAVDAEGRFSFLNEAARAVYGHDPAEMIGLPFSDFSPPGDKERDLETFSNLIQQGGDILDYQTRLYRKDGSLVTVSANARILKDETGAMVGVMGMARDITESKGTEMALRASEAKFRNIIELSPIPYALNDSDGNITYLNAAFVRCFGYTTTDIPNLETWWPLAYPDEAYRNWVAGSWAERLQICTQSGLPFEPMEISVRCKDGSYRTVMAGAGALGETLAGTHLVTLYDITDRKRAEAALRESEESFRLLAEAMPQMVWMTGADGSNFYFNQRWVEFTGLTREESSGPNWIKPFHPEDVPAAEVAWNEAVNHTGIYSIESRLRRHDGTYHWMLIRGVPLRDADGTITRWFGTCTDIDQLKRALHEARAIKKRSDLIAAVTNDAIYDWDIVANNLWWNAGLTHLFGYDPDEVEPTVNFWKSHIHPGDVQRVAQGFYRALAESRTEWRDEFHFLRKDGSYAFVLDRATIILDEAGKPVRMIGGMTDLSERRAVENKLAEQAALLDKAQDAIMVRDLQGRLTYWNKSAETLYGWSREEALGQSVRHLLYLDEPAFDEAAARLLAQGDWMGEVSQITKTGQMITVESRSTLVRDDAGEPLSILVINTDKTEQKKIEQQFLRSQRMESLGTLAGGIAHDLNNVLAPILMSMELLRMVERDANTLEILATVEASAKRAADMVRQVLTFARGVEGRRLDVDVAQLLREIQKITNETFLKHIEVKLTLPLNLSPVLGDPTQLHQVLLNLCVNARDAMPHGGLLSLTARNTTVSSTQLMPGDKAKPGPYVLLEIADTGTGMSPEVLDKIFDPFFTTKAVGAGTGLGLSTSLAIIKSHGGFIRVESELNRGSKFQVYLPMASVTAPTFTAFSPTNFARGKGETILVIDDEAAVRRVACQTLEVFGYKVIPASGGEEALKHYREHGKSIAAVFTDMMMPGMDGPTTIQALRELNPEVRVIAASGMSSPEMTEKALRLGIKAFLPKPYTAEVLLKTLRDAIA